MAKEYIRLTYDKDVYELTYTRETVKQMEQGGFDIKALMDGSKTGSMSEMLFRGAFLSRHRKTKTRVIEDIFDHLGNKSELTAALAELYVDTLSTLTDTAAVNDGKNVTWETV